jgi:hypothetical protein
VKCVARQKSITGNHVAIVDKGRAGPSCAITDSVALCDANPAAVADLTPPLEKTAMKIRIGDAEVDATNGEAVRIAVDALNVKLGGLTADNATLKTSLEAKDGEIAALNAKLKDAEVTPERLQALADARAKVIAQAQALKPGIVVDGKSDIEIRKEAVSAKLGDAAANMADAAIEGAFLALTKDGGSADPLRQTLKDGLTAPTNIANIRDAARAASNR